MMNHSYIPFQTTFFQFQGYNNPEKSKHQRCDNESMSASVLDTHASVLNSFLLRHWLDLETNERRAVCDLADAVSKYAAYLPNIEVQENHQRLWCLSDTESCVLIQGA